VSRRIEYITGSKFEGTRLTFVADVESPKSGRKAKFDCDCGNTIVANINHVKRLQIKSCGCIVHEMLIRRNVDMFTTHGASGSRLMSIYKNMKSRCYNANHKKYDLYGWRGIIICDTWNESFQAFYDWANTNGYSDSLTLERKKLDRNYCPSNCIWISQQLNFVNEHGYIQAWNTSTVNIVTIDGIEYPSIAEAERQLKITRNKITKFCDDPNISNYSRRSKN